MTSQSEGDVGLMGDSCYFQSQSYREVQKLLSLDIEFTVEVDRDVESIITCLPDFEIGEGSLAVSQNGLVGVVFAGQEGEDFVEISCKELEHPGLPPFSLELSVEVALADGKSDHVFIEIVGDKLLSSSIHAELMDIYLGLRGIKGTVLFPQIQLVLFAYSASTSKVALIPSFQMSMVQGFLTMERVIGCLPSVWEIHLQSNWVSIWWCSPCRHAPKQNLKALFTSYSSRFLTVFTDMMLLSILTRTALSSSVMSAGSYRVRAKGVLEVNYTSEASARSQLQEVSFSIVIFLASRSSSLRPKAQPVPFLWIKVFLVQLNANLTSTCPPQTTIRSLPSTSALCLESRQQNFGTVLQMTYWVVQLELKVTLSSTPIFSLSLVKVQLNSSCLPRLQAPMRSK